MDGCGGSEVAAGGCRGRGGVFGAREKFGNRTVPRKNAQALRASRVYDQKAAELKAEGKSKDEIKAILGSPPRPGGDVRGSSKDRLRHRKMLFEEWGGHEKGYIFCPWTGEKLHWADKNDKVNNPEGYNKFERGKIFTACQGGGYRITNVIPESFTANRSRNDKRIRKENSDAC